jgi:hypothetical protein
MPDGRSRRVPLALAVALTAGGVTACSSPHGDDDGGAGASDAGGGSAGASPGAGGSITGAGGGAAGAGGFAAGTAGASADAGGARKDAGGVPTDASGAPAPFPAPSFPLRVSADKRYLVDQSGAPFLIHGESGWEIISTAKQEDADKYLDDRRSRGFNSLLVELVDHIPPGPVDAYGNPPFTTKGDFSTPNEAYFAHADWVVNRAAEKGFAVFLFPCYLGYQGGPEGFYQDVLKNGAAKMRAWGRWVGNRYKNAPNIVWVDGGDYTPSAAGLALLNEVVLGIKENDTTHIHTAHWGRETSGSQVNVSWLDLNSTYSSPRIYVKSLADFNRDKLRPHFLIEAYYEGDHAMTPPMLRAQAYDALLTGATGQFFGNTPLWKFAAGWPALLATKGAISMTHVRELFGPRPWQTLEPDQTNVVLTAGQGTPASATTALLARTPDGRLAIAYVPTVREITVDFSRFAGPMNARWYDPTDGSFKVIAGTPFPNTGLRKMTPPGPNSGAATDWVLVVEATAP